MLLYEQVEWKSLLKKKPEFYVKSIRNEIKKDGEKVETNTKEETSGMGGNKVFEIKEKKLLLLGDSNVFLMSQNREEYEEKIDEKIYWLAESGVGTEFIDYELKVRLGKVQKNEEADLVKDITEKGITDVAVLLGVNSLGEHHAEELSNCLIKLSEKSGAKIFYVSVLPYVDKAKYKIDNKDIVRFNAAMKKKLAVTDVKYVDGYNEVSSVRGYEAETRDGLHYTKAIYDKVMREIINNIMQNN